MAATTEEPTCVDTARTRRTKRRSARGTIVAIYLLLVGGLPKTQEQTACVSFQRNNSDVVVEGHGDKRQQKGGVMSRRASPVPVAGNELSPHSF
jgi:hypothetical protein